MSERGFVCEPWCEDLLFLEARASVFQVPRSLELLSLSCLSLSPWLLPQHTDMPEEMRAETMELCVTACEKFATNNEVCVCVYACICVTTKTTAFV